MKITYALLFGLVAIFCHPMGLCYHAPLAMALTTKGFESLQQLRRHWQEHGDDFRASNAEEYEQMADLFLGSAKPEGVHECVRQCGRKLRYDPSSEAFGVLDAQFIIRTYFKPMPCSRVPFHEREAIRQSGRCHTYVNNFVYFQSECRK